MAGKFVCTTGNDGKFHFSLKASNGEVILSSQGYADQRGRDNGIESVRKNANDAARFQKETAKDGRFYFNLTAANAQVIGKSQMYKTESGRDNGIQSVGKHAADASVVEE